MAEVNVPFQGKQQLLKRCRELEFVDDVEDLKCTRCNRLTLEHWYTNCGHALCLNCKRLLSGGGFKCPLCDQFIQHIKEQSADLEEKVNGLQAKCPNSRYGCPLVTTVKQLMDHVVGCEWTKEQAMPAVYRGTNTTLILLEEVSSLKKQMSKMSGNIGFLFNEFHKQQEVEKEIKRSVEMSVEDFKIRLNELSSNLHYETTTLKVHLKDFDQRKIKELLDLKDTLIKDINDKITTLEKTINEINLKKNNDNIVSKEEMNTSNKLLIQILDQKEEKFNQKLTKEVEAIDIKIKALKDEMRIKKEEIDKKLDGGCEKQEVAIGNFEKKMATFSEINRSFVSVIERETKKCNKEIDQLNMKTSELEKSIDWVSQLFLADVQTIQKLNPQLNTLEALQSTTAIEQLLNRKSSVQHLTDSFLFGSMQEKMGNTFLRRTS